MTTEKLEGCNHVVGAKTDDCGEAHLVTIKEYLDYHKKYDLMFLEFRFNYCPNCGDQIIWPDQE